MSDYKCDECKNVAPYQSLEFYGYKTGAICAPCLFKAIGEEFRTEKVEADK